MFFPLFVDLSKQEILIVGGGAIAARRIRSLCGFAGHMTVVASAIAPAIRELSGRYPISLCERRYEEQDLEGKALVLAATDDGDLNARIYRDCQTRGIPANDCSDQRLCDFQFPSIVQSGDVVIGINASGKNHSLVKETRLRIEAFLKKEG